MLVRVVGGTGFLSAENPDLLETQPGWVLLDPNISVWSWVFSFRATLLLTLRPKPLVLMMAGILVAHTVAMVARRDMTLQHKEQTLSDGKKGPLQVGVVDSQPLSG